MLIKELARRTGLTPQAIRFYEKEGFLEKHYVRRRENNYRDYAEEAVEYLLDLKARHAAGFTLAELKAFREAEESGRLTTQQQVEFLGQKLHDISQKIEELEQIRAHITTLMHAKENGVACRNAQHILEVEHTSPRRSQ